MKPLAKSLVILLALLMLPGAGMLDLCFCTHVAQAATPGVQTGSGCCPGAPAEQPEDNAHDPDDCCCPVLSLDPAPRQTYTLDHDQQLSVPPLARATTATPSPVPALNPRARDTGIPPPGVRIHLLLGVLIC